MVEQTLVQTLCRLGFTDKESRVYLASLSLGEAVVSDIALKASVKRPTTYVVLGTLREKGFVNRTTAQGKEYYRAVNPNILLKDYQRRQGELEGVLPQLLSLSGSHSTDPRITAYTGREGMAQLLDDGLTAKKEIVGWFQPLGCNDDYLRREYLPKLVSERIRRKILLRGVIPYEASDEFPLEARRSILEFRETYCIDSKHFPLRNEILIYNDKVAVISFPDNVGFIFQNQYIVDSLRMVFEASYLYAKQSEKELFKKKPKKKS